MFDRSYKVPPTADEVTRVLYELDGLFRQDKPDSQRVKDALYDLSIAFRWKLAQMLGAVPDTEGRIIQPRQKPLTKGERQSLFADYKREKAA